MNVWWSGYLLWGLDGEELDEGLVCFLFCCCFFWCVCEFWNYICVMCLLRFVICVMCFKFWLFGLLFNWKLVCSICSWFFVNVVCMCFVFDFWLYLEFKKKKYFLFIISIYICILVWKIGEGEEGFCFFILKFFFYIY